MKKQFLKPTSKPLLALMACTILAGCASSGTSPNAASNEAKVNAALQRAAANVDAIGKTPSLAAAERAYNQNSADPVNAVHYAAALREEGYASRASVVLEPFANDPKSIPGVKTEYAAIQLALGNNETAERYAQKAVLQNAEDAKAFHYLGIALDAQGKHPEAERAFRKALDLWEGDPTPIMNNLALNLSTQGFLDEAVEILEKAKAVAPNRVEIERNLRIVTTLRQSANPTTPLPKRKPTPPVMSIQPAAAADDPPKPAPVPEVSKEPLPAGKKAAAKEEVPPTPAPKRKMNN